MLHHFTDVVNIHVYLKQAIKLLLYPMHVLHLNRYPTVCFLTVLSTVVYMYQIKTHTTHASNRKKPPTVTIYLVFKCVARNKICSHTACS